MSLNKTAIIRDVERSVGAVNDIITLLQGGLPLSSDVVDVNYSQETVKSFLERSQAVVNHLQSASTTTSNWLSETGNRISQNLVESGKISDALQQSSSNLVQSDRRTQSTHERITQLEQAVNAGEQNLSSAQSSLSAAENRLNEARRVRDIAFASFFVAPIVGGALLAVDQTAIRHDIDSRKESVHAIRNQLAQSRSQLDQQRVQLSSENAQRAELSSHIHKLQEEQRALGAQADGLQKERETLSQLSVSINDCLLTVNSALSSSATIPAGRSMRNVVSGIRGLVGALGADATFAGPVAQLNDSSLQRLDSGVEALRRHRLMA
ncbi:hypothetical protein C8Q79DRAFT_923296 [Trametes meyenii]|nr:hypothetical protein C8Q79DRAFT_923296 [Trametes meyenii]